MPEDIRSHLSEVAQKSKHKIIPTLLSILYDVPCRSKQHAADRQPLSTYAAAVGWLANQDAAYHHVPATWGHMRVHASRCVKSTHVV